LLRHEHQKPAHLLKNQEPPAYQRGGSFIKTYDETL